MKEGLLIEVKGKIYPYDEFESYLYGYDNRYGLIVQRTLGGPRETDTKDADKGLYEVLLIGIGLKASEIKVITSSKREKLFEPLRKEEFKNILENPEIEKFISNFDSDEKKFTSISKEDIATILDVIKNQPEREAMHIVKDPMMNPYYSIKDAARDYKKVELREIDF